MYAERRIAGKKSVLLTGNSFEQCKAAQTLEIPTSPLAEAVNYALNHRPALEKFLHDPGINIFAQWLNDVMIRLPDTPVSQLDPLLPGQWH